MCEHISSHIFRKQTKIPLLIKVSTWGLNYLHTFFILGFM